MMRAQLAPWTLVQEASFKPGQNPHVLLLQKLLDSRPIPRYLTTGEGK